MCFFTTNLNAPLYITETVIILFKFKQLQSLDILENIKLTVISISLWHMCVHVCDCVTVCMNVSACSYLSLEDLFLSKNTEIPEFEQTKIFSPSLTLLGKEACYGEHILAAFSFPLPLDQNHELEPNDGTFL